MPSRNISQEEDKRKRQQLKEARIAFLEEELPALVAKGASLGAVWSEILKVRRLETRVSRGSA